MNIYQANILDKFNNPTHRHKPAQFTHSATVENLTCGDQVTMYLTISDGLITDIGFEGEGCVISLAAAEIIAAEITGQAVDKVAKLTWEDAVKMLNIELSMTRIKCAHLSLEAIQQASAQNLHS
jgi:nitrogen fixation NifU-like protein